jgi:hypothetical protein
MLKFNQVIWNVVYAYRKIHKSILKIKNVNLRSVLNVQIKYSKTFKKMRFV